MNGLAVLLSVSLLGVQQTWRTTPEGQLEYVLQVEPTFLASLEQGESVTSNLPATAKEVHRLCLRFSAADLKKAPQRNLELPPLATAEERAKNGELDIPVALIVDAEGHSEQITDVSHGWQATNDGRVQYLVQLSPDLLGKIQEGDEIHMNLYSEAGQIQQFIVSAGKEVLPRNGVKAHPPAKLTAKNHNTVAPAAAETATVYGPVAEEAPAAAPRSRAPRTTEAPVVESRAHESRATEPPKLRNPTRHAVNVATTEQPAEEPAEQPLYGPAADGNPGAAPELITDDPAAETPQEPEQPLYGAAKFGAPRATPHVAAGEASPFDHSRFDKGQIADAPVNKPKTNHVGAPKTTDAALTPPDNRNEYLSDSETRHSKPPSSFGASDGNVATTGAEERQDLDNRRTASLDTSRGKTKLSAGTVKSPKKSTADEVPTASFGSWTFVCCALFLSIGGNLYLGWTAAEFYSRYRKAIERMRGGREADND